jgi:hypothetical protein
VSHYRRSLLPIFIHGHCSILATILQRADEAVGQVVEAIGMASMACGMMTMIFSSLLNAALRAHRADIDSLDDMPTDLTDANSNLSTVE